MSETTLRRWAPILLALIMLVAAGLRLWRLAEIPPGLTHDEADVGYFVRQVYLGQPADLHVPYGYANEPYTMFSGALLMRLLGPTYLTQRVHQAIYGLLVVLVAYLWGRRAFGVEVGLSAAALVAAAFWTLFTSRMALNSQPLPALYGLAAYAMWRLWFDDEARPAHVAGWAALFGAGLAASLHVYEASRVTWLAFPAFAAHQFIADRARLRRRGLAFGAALLVGLGLAAPHLLDPSAWGRTSTLAEPLLALRRGDPGPLLANAWAGLGTLVVRGDPFVTYNLPGRPVLRPWLAIFFVVGVALSAWRWRRPERAFALLWLGVGIAPTLVIGAFTCTLHSIAAQPVVYTLTAFGGVEAARFVARRFGDQAGRIAAVVWVTIVAANGALAARDYFRWGELPETRAAYFHTLAEMLDHVEREAPSDSIVVISSPFPAPPLDPYIGLMRLRRDDVETLWVDGRAAVILPQVDEALLLTSLDAPLDPALADWLVIDDVRRIETRPDDANPAFRVMRLDAGTSRARIAGQMMPVGEEAPVFGGALALEGVLNPPEVASPGDEIVVTMWWRVVAPDALGPVPPDRFTHEVVIFVQALDAAGGYVAGQDVVGAPFASWRAGDGVLHVHRLPLPDDTPPGELRLIAGLYVRPEGGRLAASTGGDFVELGTISIR